RATGRRAAKAGQAAAHTQYPPGMGWTGRSSQAAATAGGMAWEARTPAAKRRGATPRREGTAAVSGWAPRASAKRAASTGTGGPPVQSIHTPSAAGSTAGVSWAHASQTAGVGGIRRHAMTDMPLGPPCDQMFGDLYANICSVPVVKTEHRASPEEMGGKAAKPVPVRGRGSVPGRTMSQSPGLWRRVVPYR